MTIRYGVDSGRGFRCLRFKFVGCRDTSPKFRVMANRAISGS